VTNQVAQSYAVTMLPSTMGYNFLTYSGLSFVVRSNAARKRQTSFWKNWKIMKIGSIQFYCLNWRLRRPNRSPIYLVKPH